MKRGGAVCGVFNPGVVRLLTENRNGKRESAEGYENNIYSFGFLRGARVIERMRLGSCFARRFGSATSGPKYGSGRGDHGAGGGGNAHHDDHDHGHDCFASRS